MPAALPRGLDARGMSFVLRRGHAVERLAGLRPGLVAQAEQAHRPWAGPVHGPAPGRPRPPDLDGRGRHAARGDRRAGPAARPAPDADQGRAPQPDRQLARPVRGARGLAGRGHLGDDRVRRRRGPVRVDGRVRGPGRPALGEPGRARRHQPQPGCDRGGRRPRGRRRLAGGALAAPRRRRAVARAGGRSRIARCRPSAATRCRSRATARSPTRSPRSCAGPRPTSCWCPRPWATASRASGAASATW